jgi:DNA repair exonuclease SbcCD nuclease subunit
MAIILHLSDLHLGELAPNDITEEFKSEIVPIAERPSRYNILQRTLKELCSRLDSGQLSAVIISGDTTVRNREDGFKKLEEVLSCLGPQCPEPDRIVVVPGNHDVQRDVIADPQAKYAHFLKYVRARGFITPLIEGSDMIDDDLRATDLAKHHLLDAERRWAVVPISR